MKITISIFICRQLLIKKMSTYTNKNEKKSKLIISDDDSDMEQESKKELEDSELEDEELEEDKDIEIQVLLPSANIITIYHQYLSNPKYLELHPLYQRDICWKKEKKKVILLNVLTGNIG